MSTPQTTKPPTTFDALKRRIVQGQRRRRPDSFGTYLETVQNTIGSQPADLPARLLTVLSASGPCLISELFMKADAPLTEVLGALRSLREFGLISIVGDPTDGKIEITPSGSRTAQVIR